MAIPLQSLSGTEVLRRGTIHAQTTTQTTFNFADGHPTTGQAGNTVPTNHIVTILSIIICEQSNSADNFDLWVIAPGIDLFLLKSQSIGAFQTYVWSEKISLTGGESLAIVANAAANFDVYYSYIDQSWV
tara:strand:+ start:385 stop:774 length:390 start_codon:yes stop_codon:yes gene_type:complete